MKLKGWLFLIIGALLLYFVVNQYFFCPRYTFQKPHNFSGDKIFNPYQHSGSAVWRRCNFHAHTRTFSGLTNGKGTAAELWSIYDSLGYDVHCISQYERVNRYSEKDSNFIPAYEHGLSFGKHHHGLLGTYRVNWGDYIFPQTLSNKQHLLDCLQRDSSAFVIINHPMVRNGFPPDDFKYLENYDAIEVLRANNTYSLLQWDAALTAGIRAFIVASDDAHDSSNPFEVGRNCTFVNAPLVSSNTILQAIKSGEAYGMRIHYIPGETMQQKIARFRKGFPTLNAATMAGDTLKVSVSESAQQILFFGQDLQQLGASYNTSVGSYIFKPADSYVRTQIYFADGNTIFLNPVFRYTGVSYRANVPVVNSSETILFRVMGIIILALYLLFTIGLIRRKWRWEKKNPGLTR